MVQVQLPKPSIIRDALSSFEKGVAELMRRNDVKTLPVMIIRESPKVGVSHTTPAYSSIPHPTGVIIFDETYARQGATPINLAMYGHEFGHILADHPIHVGFGGTLIDKRAVGEQAKQYVSLKRYQCQELEADRIAVHLTDSPSSILDLRKAMQPGNSMGDAMLGLEGVSRFNPKAFLHRWGAGRVAREYQGTPTEIAANVASVDLKQRNFVDKLIEERERRITAFAKE